MSYPDFDIMREGKVVGRFKDDKLLTEDRDLMSLVNLGVVARTGGHKADGTHFDGLILRQVKDPGFFAAFVTRLLDEGYSVPLWVTQSLA